jgi:hypothetical protein
MVVATVTVLPLNQKELTGRTLKKRFEIVGQRKQMMGSVSSERETTTPYPLVCNGELSKGKAYRLVYNDTLNKGEGFPLGSIGADATALNRL